MSENVRRMHAPPEKVWKVLSDGWLYPVWVVGASRMREVDDDWPAAGSRLHHSVGLWPALIDDNTEVLESAPNRSMTLRARAWPVGEAQVTINLLPVGEETDVEILEDAVSGPGRFVPQVARTPMLKWRNTETLRRLAFLAERR
ncbi:MAG: hypothetical protein JWN68_2195 [Nocardioides sp.]|jgi:uncharacterized protein YndB with AHSA1/START domain|uniref:SRPBCC family protein n=1 Tax=Nocardioides sp. TaxID=35761 RepID=UPI00261DA7DC|nr:SRPBCC family protein [Nocardioides sp.]MCW2834242.1 hypothetical protein [Nocardioides sp.]